MFQSKLSAGVMPVAIAFVLSLALCGPVQAQQAAAGLEPAPGAAAPLSAEDNDFLQLRDAARHNDAARAEALAAKLAHYPLASYVDYYRLKPRLREALQDEVLHVLRRHEGTAIAERLRNEWLAELGRRQDWTTFQREVGSLADNGDLAVRCHALTARAVRGEKVAQQARALLKNPPAYGEACAGLIAQLARSGQFTQDDLLWQLRIAGLDNATGPARRAAVLLGLPEKRAAQAVDSATLALARGIGTSRGERELYLVAVGRAARTSLKIAVASLEKNSPRLSKEERQIGWANVALAASIAVAPEAHTYWKRAGSAKLTEFQTQWKTRVALRSGDWATVRATIEDMPDHLQDDPTWVYWRGRALQAQGHPKQARKLFERIAGQHTFYAQLAHEELGHAVVAPPPVRPSTPAELAAVEANASLQRALHFYRLGLRAEGNREWSWGLRGMSDRQLLAAGELARKHELLDRMVETSLRTRGEQSYEQRFPAPHLDVLKPTAQNLGLDKAWVYGLIRQESRFIQDARSGVGATGLMQVMPATGQWVASKIGLENFVHDMLHDLRTNITLGSNYMNMVLGNFDGSQVLATIAYNAGPGRARNWRGRLDAPMEGAIFVESIPFAETRGYVRNVMANATNYAAMFEGKPQSLKERLGNISPRAAASALD